MGEYLRFDPVQMRDGFNARAFAFTHRLHEEPLFDLARLARLAEFLYERHGKRDVHNAAAGKRFNESFGANNVRGLGPGEAIERIDTSDSWMVLKRIEQHPEYREVVEACMAQLAQAVPELQPQRVRKAEGFIFVTSPGGITPYHIDPQWSFLAQIRGRKTYRIYDVLDPTVIPEEEIDRYYAGETMAAQYAPEKDARAAAFHLEPGMAVNQPLHAPHSAQVDGVSISMTVAVISDAWEWQRPVRCANHWLRTHGMRPAPLGAHPLADGLKGFTYRASAKIARTLAPEKPAATKAMS